MSTLTLIELLAQARRAKLTLGRDPDGMLRIRGPREAEPLVRALLARKEDVLAAMAYYGGEAPVLNWKRATVLGEPQPCTRCGSPAHLLDPYDGKPWHKSCAEAAIRWGAAPGSTPRANRRAAKTAIKEAS